jgi:hypothetical protein
VNRSARHGHTNIGVRRRPIAGAVASDTAAGDAHPPGAGPETVKMRRAFPVIVALAASFVALSSSAAAQAPIAFGATLEPAQATAGGAPKWVWAALLMAGFAGISAFTMALARVPARRTPPPFVGTLAATEAPDEAARRELSAIAAAGHLDRGELREHYRRIAVCLRRYLSERFGVPAAPMTPQELESRLESLDVDSRLVRLAVDLLKQCEAVQHAGYEPARDQAESDLGAAREIVALTSPPVPRTQAGEEALKRP